MYLRENNFRDGNTFSLVLITFSRFPVYRLFDDVDSFYSVQTDLEYKILQASSSINKFL